MSAGTYCKMHTGLCNKVNVIIAPVPILHSGASMKPIRYASVLTVLFSLSLFAAEPWEGAPFTADPQAMLAAAEAVRPAKPEEGVIVLLDEARVTFDAEGRSTRVERLIYRVLDESAVEGWSTIETMWSPWYHEQPTVDARVIAKDGAVHRLDPKSFGVADAADEPDMFSDTRVLSGPLPAVAPGSVVEQTITWREKNPLYTAGTTDRHAFGRWVETRQARLVIEWPSTLELRTVNRTRPAIEPKKTESGGMTRLLFETGPIPALDFSEWDAPADANLMPYVAWSTGKSWQEVAKRYAEIVDGKIGDLTSVDRIVKAALGNANADAKTPRDIAVRLLAALERDIRYAGVEFGEGSIVPRTPVETLKNKYGDCKDKATLLVAMLRRAGVMAHVALLRSGRGYDVEPELPGLGYFNHVIVVVEGDEPLWIDPTDEFARAGELPDSDQGRLALIAKAGTATLTKTPQEESRANRSVETREFKLAEDGKARVIETSEYFGSDERATRRYYNGTDQKEIREGLKNYAEQIYLAKSLAKWESSTPRDLSKPFRIRLEMEEATRGTTSGGEAAVGVFLSRMVSDLPEGLRTEVDEKDPDYKPRRHDFELPKPYVLELHYVVEPPPGYVVRTVPENETVKLGTTTLTKAYRVREDGVLLADYTFDSGPRRMTAAQYEETRRAVVKVVNEPALLLSFDQLGRKYLDAGEVGKAVAELRRLAALHPKEALHHADVARALLAGGMGAAARREAQRAIEVEPKSARGHHALGFVLTHDLIGRELRNGFDLDGAVAAYRKAKELAPQDINIRAELAMLLQHDKEGIRYRKDARLGEAVDEYLAMKKDIEDANAEAIDRELMPLYAHLGRWDALQKLVAETKDTERKHVFQLVAAAAEGGGEAAVKASQSIEPAKRRDAQAAAAGTLAVLRLYPAAAALLAEAAQGSPNAAQLRVQADMMRKTVRVEELKLDPSDPKSAWLQSITEFARTGAIDTLEQFGSAEMREVFAEEGIRTGGAKAAGRRISREMRQQGEFLADIGMAAIDMQQDGNETVGYRLRGRAPVGQAEGMTIYVVKEKGAFRVAASHTSPPSLALRALRLAEQNDLAGARQWLDWARDHVSSGYEDDPLRSEPFAMLWTRGKEATLDEARLAAAILLPETKRSSEIALPILTAARATATPEVQTRIDQALLSAYTTLSKWEEVLAAADRLAEKHPDSPRAFLEGITALSKLGRDAEAKARATARLQRLADDRAALTALATLALDRSEFAEAMAHYKRLLDGSKPSYDEYNQHAWTSLFAAGADLETAVQSARQATALRPDSYASLNTLATLYAEQGNSSEARDTLLKSLEYVEDQLHDADWYVVGRIAENYGIRDVALEAYRKVGKPAIRDTTSPWELAQKRLAGLK
jgi:tetratricopeptide (TPR) repeat protein